MGREKAQVGKLRGANPGSVSLSVSSPPPPPQENLDYPNDQVLLLSASPCPYLCSAPLYISVLVALVCTIYIFRLQNLICRQINFRDS